MMSELKHAESFRDLIVYQKSRQLQREIFRITKSFPKEETYSLTDQNSPIFTIYWCKHR